MPAASLPTRILMTADTIGGVFTYSLELARALEPRGVEFTLATMGNLLSDDQRAELSGLDNVELFESDWKLEWMGDAADDVRRAGEWLLEIEASTAPDCIHLNGYGHAALPFNAPSVVVAHSCVLSWWEAVRRTPIPESLASYRELVAQGLSAARVVVAPTRAMLAALERHYGPVANGRVIGNATSPLSPEAEAKLPYVMAAGRLWDEAKNVSALAHVAPELEWPLVLAGDNKNPDGTHVSYTGVRELGCVSRAELGQWLAAASIYALPARYEPFGLSVLEAALAGCALVLGDTESLRESWSDAAVFVAPDDEKSLARLLSYLIAEPTRRAELAHAARQRARSFAPEAMADAYLGVYAQAMGQARAVASESSACMS
jgi:glycogen(starch) synthase